MQGRGKGAEPVAVVILPGWRLDAEKRCDIEVVARAVMAKYGVTPKQAEIADAVVAAADSLVTARG